MTCIPATYTIFRLFCKIIEDLHDNFPCYAGQELRRSGSVGNQISQRSSIHHMANRKTAIGNAHSNIAFIKYWGNADEHLRIPVNGSISMNLAGLVTRTSVTFDDSLNADAAIVDGETFTGAKLDRITRHLDAVRRIAGVETRAEVLSNNNFPAGAGIASSASAFAALSVTASAALGLSLSERELSSLARLGSGSASRSIPEGFVEWFPGNSHESSYAETIAPADHWQLTDLIVILSQAHKATGSTEGHTLAGSSPLQSARVESAPARLDLCRKAILSRDFDMLAEVVELDSNIMHSVMMTSNPPLFYWQPETLAVMRFVRKMRSSGIGVCYTIDAGANVHVICAPGDADRALEHLGNMPGVIEVRRAGPGSGAWVERENA
jgi:diphosphomevalonate decarboxylase